MGLALAPPPPEHALFDALAPVVLRWCTRLAAPGVDAEAAAQEVLLVVLRRQAELQPGASAEAWAWGITRHVLRAERRKAWLRRWVPGGLLERGYRPDPADALAGDQVARQVHDVLATLPDLHREVLVLVAIEGRPVAEAAQLLGVPEGTVKSRLFLARGRFRAEAERRGHHFDLTEPEEDDV